MTQQIIVLSTGQRIRGRLVDHLGQGRAIIEYDGHQAAGEKLESWQRRQDRLVSR